MCVYTYSYIYAYMHVYMYFNTVAAENGYRQVGFAWREFAQFAPG